MRFHDRLDAGRGLATALRAYAGREPIVLALPRGGVAVGAAVARALKAPLDLVLVRKIAAPRRPELALGAVVDGGAPTTVCNRELQVLSGTSVTEFDAIRARELAEIERRHTLYLGKRPPLDVAGRLVILVDDGVATGATVRAALPVASPVALASLRSEADDIVCLASPREFRSVGDLYDDFRQMTDEDVIALLKRQPAAPVTLP
jgi:putative phosphoribosyl transferase